MFNRKTINFQIFIIFLTVLLLFSSCGRGDENETTESAGNDVINFNYEEKNTAAGVNSEKQTSLSNDSGGNPDQSQNSNNGSKTDPILDSPTFLGTALYLSPDDKSVFSPLIYEGGDFTFYLQVSLGSEGQDYGVGFMLNGIYQDIKLEYDGKTTDYAPFHIVFIPGGKIEIIKVYMRPNTGKKGDVLNFCNGCILDPSALVTSTDYLSYNLNQCSLEKDLQRDFTMNSDGTGTASVCSNFSGMSVNNYNSLIKQSFRYRNDAQELCQSIIYNELSEALYEEREGIYTQLFSSVYIEAEAEKNYPLTITLGERPGTTQRVSFYLNGEMMPVFDGKYYADVKIENNKQTDLKITLDTSKLEEWNKIYIITSENNPKEKSIFNVNQSDVYIFRVIR